MLSGLLVSALDFSFGVIVLPLVVFNLVAVLVANLKAKHQNGKFGLPILKFSSTFICVILTLIFALFLLNDLEVLTLKPLITLYFDSPLILAQLLNVGFANVKMFALPLTIFFLSKVVANCTFSNCVRKNMPKCQGFIVSLILIFISLALFVFDALSRTEILRSDYGYELPSYILAYASVATITLAAIAVILEIVSVIISFFKLRNSKCF